MTLAELVADVKRLIGPGFESSKVGDEGLKSWFNEAYADVITTINDIVPDYFAKSSTTNLYKNLREYELPSDFEKILMVNVKYSTDWVRCQPMPNINYVPTHASNLNTNFSTGSPQYYIKGDRLGIMPFAETTVTGGLKLWYIYTPAELTADSDTPNIKRNLQHILKYSVMANYLDQDNEYVAAENMRRRYDAKLEKIVTALAERQVDEPLSVEITQNQDMFSRHPSEFI